MTAHTQRFVRSVWTLDRELAYARHYPAVAWSGSWYARQGDAAWTRRREQVVTLLSDADRLGALDGLVGVGAMPGAERVVMLGGRLLREGVLQQSSLSANDAFCSPAKGAALLDGVLAVIDRCDALFGSSVPAARIEEMDFDDLLRAAQETGPHDVTGVQERLETAITRLGQLS